MVTWNSSTIAHMTRPVVQFAALAWLSCVVLEPFATATETASVNMETVTVTSMAEAMDALVSRYGYVVTLETPPYTNNGDLMDQPAQSRNDSDQVIKGTAPKLWISRPTPVTLVLPPSAEVSGVSSLVKKLVEDTATSDHGAHFRMEQEGDVFHIIPIEVRDVRGNWVAAAPVLDTRISVPTADRSILETLKAVCSAVGDAAHVRVGLLQVPTGFVRSWRSTVGSNDEPARSVFTRALKSSGKKMSWRIFFDIPMNSYLLSVFVVPDSAGAAPVSK